MSRASSKNRERKINEWERKEDNIGITSTLPYQILTDHINGRAIIDIVSQFFDNAVKEIHLLDLYIIEQQWWQNEEIVAARYIQIKHPKHYSGEYIFDKASRERTIIEFRQLGFDGKHWNASHLHIKRGSIDTANNCKITKLTYNEHIAIIAQRINGVFIMKIFDDPNNKGIPKI